MERSQWYGSTEEAKASENGEETWVREGLDQAGDWSDGSSTAVLLTLQNLFHKDAAAGGQADHLDVETGGGRPRAGCGRRDA